MNGVIILDKPADFTSFDAVAVMRGLTGERKIGHTGTLDPMATGVLPLLLGRAAKAADLLPDTDKVYRARFRIGERRSTGDVTGEIVERGPRALSGETLAEALRGFRGEIRQIPPMYSAVSVGGTRLYELARQGREIEREPRRVTIHSLTLEAYDEASGEGELCCACSKGTYIRVLIEDVAKAAGTCACMTGLRRECACGFSLEEAVPLEELRSAAEEGRLGEVLRSRLRPVDSLFQGCRWIGVSPAQAGRFRNGGALDLKRLRLPREPLSAGETLRIYGGEEFLGLARADLERGELRFLKLFA